MLSELDASGEQTSRYCAARGINAKTLKWWRWRLRQKRSAKRSTSVRLVTVDVAPQIAEPHFVAIIAGGAEMRVEVGTDVSYVGALVKALRATC